MRRLLLATAAILAVLLPGTPAWAHNALIGSAPAPDATLANAPTGVALEFREHLNPKFTTIVVFDAARQPVPATAPAIVGARGTVTLNGPLGNGRYTVAYRIVSVDGHAAQGAYTFTVADPAQPAAPASQPAGTAAAGGGFTIGVGGAVLALAGLAGCLWLITVLLGRRRRSGRGIDGDGGGQTAGR
jgi:copper resistance protein C